MFGYILVGGVLTFTVVVPAIKVAIEYGKKYNKHKKSGIKGEEAVARCLKGFKGKDFSQLRDIMLDIRGKTSQIDNILVSRYGVFVIEMKNYSGVITGRARSPRWLQSSFKGSGSPREFYNPIWQNEGHIRALKDVLTRSYPRLPYHNIVVFSDNSRIPELPGVVRLSALPGEIRALTRGKPLLSQNDVAIIKNLLEKSNVLDRDKRLEHVDYAKKTAFKSNTREKENELRQLALAHSAEAAAVQQLYSGFSAREGGSSLDDTIALARNEGKQLRDSAVAVGIDKGSGEVGSRAADEER